MSKVKAFTYIFIKSISSIKWYMDLIKTSTAFSLKYFFPLTFFAALIPVIMSVPPVLKATSWVSEEVNRHITSIYPQDLVITVKDDKLSINQPQPYFIQIPGSLKERIIQSVEDNTDSSGAEERQDIVNELNEVENLVVFDSQGTLDDLQRYKTFILVNEVNILLRSSNKTEVFPLRDIPDGEFAKPDADRIVLAFSNFIKALPYLIIIFILLAFLFYYMVFRLFYLAFVGLVLFGIGKIMRVNTVSGVKMDYGKYFQIAIHTFTLPLLVEMISMLFGMPILIPFWVFVLNMLLGIVVLNAFSNNKLT